MDPHITFCLFVRHKLKIIVFGHAVFFMDTLHSDVSDYPECLGATKNRYYRYIIAVPYWLGSILQYTDLPVYRDSPN